MQTSNRTKKADLLTSTHWSVLASRKWAKSSGILHLEASSLLWAVRHLCRRTASLGHRHVILSDNLAVVAAVAKGRAAHFVLNHCCRAIAAHAILSNCRFYIRWIPSELNPADLPSRQQLAEGDTVAAEPCYTYASPVSRSAPCPEQMLPRWHVRASRAARARAPLGLPPLALAAACLLVTGPPHWAGQQATAAGGCGSAHGAAQSRAAARRPGS